jgi:hypothetical protein
MPFPDRRFIFSELVRRLNWQLRKDTLGDRGTFEAAGDGARRL